MCPNLRSKDYKLYESNSPYTQYLKNIPEGSKVGGGAYFDGNNYCMKAGISYTATLPTYIPHRVLSRA